MTNVELEMREKLLQEEYFAMSYNFINDNIGKLLDFNEEEFGATICMLMEEYCKVKKLDIPKFAEMLFSAIVVVNNMYGRY